MPAGLGGIFFLLLGLLVIETALARWFSHALRPAASRLGKGEAAGSAPGVAA